MAIELLAPAGDKQAFKAAIDFGADAVYLGVGGFNARSKADNFSLDELESIVGYAHLFNVKVYLTVNTLIKNREVENFFDIIVTAYNAGIDAFIIQDVGMASALKKNIPDITLHASTQMAVSDSKSTQFLKSEIGLSRIVLSREVDLNTASQIAKDIETEIFVHGALCVGFSGYCYFSSVMSGNSGNRGLCLQPCRRRYTAVSDGKIIGNGYLLSTADLCLVDDLNTIIKSRVNAIKIEGRLRRAEYVAGVVKIYRKAIDGGAISAEDIDYLKRLFNRGNFSKGYYYDNNNIIYKHVQGHLGQCVAEIQSVSDSQIIVKSKRTLSSNDCFKIIGDSVEKGSAILPESLGNNKYKLKYRGKLKAGDSLHITSDSVQLDELKNSPSKKKSIDMYFSGRVGEKALLQAVMDNMQVTVQSEDILETAKSITITNADIEKNLKKTADTPFEIANIRIDIDDIFITKAEINNLRRSVLERLQEYENKPYVKNIKRILPKLNTKQAVVLHRNGDIIVVDSKDKLTNCDLDTIGKIIYFPEIYSLNNTKNFISAINALKPECEIYLYIPQFLRVDDEKIISEILQSTSINAAISSYSFISYLGKSNKKILVYNLNVFNSFTVEFLAKYNISDICLSKELSSGEIKDIVSQQGNVNFYILAYGAYENMLLNHCPKKVSSDSDCAKCSDFNLQYGDELKNTFPIFKYKIKNCYFRLLNSVKIDIRNKIGNLNIGRVYDFTSSSAFEIERVTLDKKFNENTTTGAFIRGVKSTFKNGD